LLTQINSRELQWSEFIANEHNCLLESGLSNQNYLAQDPIGIFNSFDELFTYLKSKPELLNFEDLGFTILKSYEAEEYIQLYTTIEKLENIEIKYPIEKIDGEIIYPDKEHYKKAVEKCQKYIHEGDIYQANLCHEFVVKPSADYSLKQIKNLIYSRLRKLNPTNYLAIADFGKWLVFSSSPESLLKIDHSSKDGFELISSPIKGTALLEDSLEELKNEKESAEHIMIVDLIRNDLGRIAKTGSVKVSKLLYDTKHSNLQHLESDVTADLDEKFILEINSVKIPDFKEIFKAIFPGGSITGAPKIRSMQVIDELESKKRVLFTGSLGFYKFKKQKGAFNILIRSIFYNKETGALSFNTGAGITSASDPEKEYEETLLKAQKLIEVFE
jgi:para-aminobenzoate synthetase component I